MDVPHTTSAMHSNTTDDFHVTGNFLNGTTVNRTQNKDFTDDPEYKLGRMVVITTFPPIIIFGTIGNVLTFFVMQQGSLKDSSTCFYMSVLALADTGKCKFTIYCCLYRQLCDDEL